MSKLRILLPALTLILACLAPKLAHAADPLTAYQQGWLEEAFKPAAEDESEEAYLKDRLHRVPGKPDQWFHVVSWSHALKAGDPKTVVLTPKEIAFYSETAPRDPLAEMPSPETMKAQSGIAIEIEMQIGDLRAESIDKATKKIWDLHAALDAKAKVTQPLTTRYPPGKLYKPIGAWPALATPAAETTSSGESRASQTLSAQP
jgi:hypothetical protein